MGTCRCRRQQAFGPHWLAQADPKTRLELGRSTASRDCGRVTDQPPLGDVAGLTLLCRAGAASSGFCCSN
jgi:hypothetical protein